LKDLTSENDAVPDKWTKIGIHVVICLGNTATAKNIFYYTGSS